MKRILITGAASGLGAQLAKFYAAQGYNVCLADIQQEAGEALAQELKDQHGNDCFFQLLDVTSEPAWQDTAQVIAKRWQGLDILVNNAGVASSGEIDELSMADYQWTMDINVMGVVKGCYVFTPMLKQTAEENGKATIVNVASMAGLIHMPTMSAYNASKAAVVALSETLYAELDSYGVHVSVLCPAFFQTNLTKTMRATNQAGVSVANKLMERSNVQVEDVVKAVYDGVEKNKFYILTHAREKFLWRLKRFVPGLFFGMMKNLGQKFKKKISQKLV